MRPYIDLHCDTISVLERHPEYGTLKENQGQVDLNRLLLAGCAGQIFACFIEKTDFCGEDGWDAGYRHAHRLLDALQAELEKNRDIAVFVRAANDVSVYQTQGKLSAFASIEEGGILNGDISRLDALYQRGVRLMTLTWNFENCIGYPNSHDSAVMNRGLKAFGHEVVERMQTLGMIVDVSHLSDGGFYDVANASKKSGLPFAASHSCARALTKHPRNLTDEMLKIIGETGSVAGVNFFHKFASGSGYTSVADIVRHVLYMVDKAGEDAVAIGSDFDGMDDRLEINGAQKMPLLFDALKKAHLTEASIDKICFGNAMRLFKNVWRP